MEANTYLAWKLFKIFYRKLRLSEDWVKAQLSQYGFEKIDSIIENGLITIVGKSDL